MIAHRTRTPRLARDAAGRFVSIVSRIEMLISMAGQNSTHHVTFSAVRKRATLSELVGFDIHGFRHAVSNQAISHTLKNHGNPIVEKARGQVSIIPNDFSLLPTIVRLGTVREPDAHKSKNPRFVITAEIDGIGYFYVGEVRRGRRRLDMVSLRKKQGGW